MQDHDHPVDPDRVFAARKCLISPTDASRLGTLLGLLQDPVRQRILSALSGVDELCVGDLALALEVSDDTVSYALRLLRMSALVSFRKHGRIAYYRLSDVFPHQLLQQCLRELLTIVAPEAHSKPVA